MGLSLSLALHCCVFGVLMCLRKSIVCLVLLFCLITTGTTIGLGRQGAGGYFSQNVSHENEMCCALERAVAELDGYWFGVGVALKA